MLKITGSRDPLRGKFSIFVILGPLQRLTYEFERLLRYEKGCPSCHLFCGRLPLGYKQNWRTDRNTNFAKIPKNFLIIKRDFDWLLFTCSGFWRCIMWCEQKHTSPSNPSSGNGSEISSNEYPLLSEGKLKRKFRWTRGKLARVRELTLMLKQAFLLF